MGQHNEASYKSTEVRPEREIRQRPKLQKVCDFLCEGGKKKIVQEPEDPKRVRI
jgi:hypothetical protein